MHAKPELNSTESSVTVRSCNQLLTIYWFYPHTQLNRKFRNKGFDFCRQEDMFKFSGSQISSKLYKRWLQPMGEDEDDGKCLSNQPL